MPFAGLARFGGLGLAARLFGAGRWRARGLLWLGSGPFRAFLAILALRCLALRSFGSLALRALGLALFGLAAVELEDRNRQAGQLLDVGDCLGIFRGNERKGPA